ncbi:MAG: hypothetical protein ABWX89_02785, partial [Paeniglutamicibacter terrestris]
MLGLAFELGSGGEEVLLDAGGVVGVSAGGSAGVSLGVGVGVGVGSAGFTATVTVTVPPWSVVVPLSGLWLMMV